MKKFMVALTLIASFIPYHVLAEDHAKDKKILHYQVYVESSEAAFEALDKKILEIDNILKDKSELDFLDLEKIHEISYTIEAAVERLRTEKAVNAGKLDMLDEAVQAIHFSSEKQIEPKIREWFIKLKKAVNNINADHDNDIVEKRDFYEVVIKDHKFSPVELVVPAGQRIKLIVINKDPTPEEFESHDFNREKIIAGNSKATIFIGPLKAGRYDYFGEFNMDTAKAYIIAK